VFLYESWRKYQNFAINFIWSQFQAQHMFINLQKILLYAYWRETGQNMGWARTFIMKVTSYILHKWETFQNHQKQKCKNCFFFGLTGWLHFMLCYLASRLIFFHLVSAVSPWQWNWPSCNSFLWGSLGISSKSNQYWSLENPRLIHKVSLHDGNAGVLWMDEHYVIIGPIFCAQLTEE
jgi:hypothetical protein